MTYTPLIDASQLKVQANDPREMLAAVSWMFREIPRNSLVLLGYGQELDSPLKGAAARFSLDDDHFGLLVSSIHVCQRFVAEGAIRLVALLSGDPSCEAGEELSTAITDTEFFDSHLELALSLGASLHELDPQILFIAHVIHGNEALVVTADKAAVEVQNVSVGDVRSSAFAANCVAAGHSFSLDRGRSLALTPSVAMAIRERWRQLPSISQLQGPAEARALAYPQQFHYLQEFWKTASPQEIVTKCEQLELHALGAHHGPWRDEFLEQFLGSFMKLKCGDLRLVTRLIDDRTFTPTEAFLPGGEAFACAEAWLELWVIAKDAGAPGWLREGLAYIAAHHTLIAWWSGRMLEARKWAAEIEAAHPGVGMAQLVISLVDAHVAPPWMDSLLNPL